MIAFIKETEDTVQTPSMRKARRMVVDTLLESDQAADSARPVKAWRAWLFTVWVMAVVVVYFACMVGWM